MKTQIVLGSLFGDEGKGNTVQWLCKESIARGEKPLVIRFSGGAQAGHRVIHNGVEHVCSLFGSGVLLGCDTYLDKQVFVDPVSLKNEWEILISKGLNPKIYAHTTCRAVIPSDILCNKKNKETIEHGTCGCGIYECYKRYDGDYMPDYLYNTIHEPLVVLRNNYPECEELKEADEEFIEACNWLKGRIIFTNIFELESEYDAFIFEGSQGLGLDMECGYMPHCTPSKVGLNGLELRYIQDAEVYLVMRTYLTRHGNGYDPDEFGYLEENYQNLEEPTNLDTGIQGKFKIGILNQMLANDIVSRHHLDNYQYLYNLDINIVVTHMDCIKKHLVCEIEFANPTTITQNLYNFFKNYFDRLKISQVFGGYSPESDIREFK